MPKSSKASKLLVALILGSAVAAGGADREHRVSQVRPATGEIVIDGVIEEPAWQDALRLELNFEVDPGENTEPPVATEFFITYTTDAVLVAFRCFDPAPEQIRARYWDRDNMWPDDWIGIMFDTFNDQRRAYEFVSNPLGVQLDAINDDVNDNYDDSWDAIWESAGRLTDEGYELEFRVPFSQMRFPDNPGEQTWGFDVFRSYPRQHRHHIGFFPRNRGENSYLAQADKLVGFAGIKTGRNIEVAPTATWVRSDERPDFPEGQLEKLDSKAEVGLTAKWGVTPNITLGATINPDFSQVEADSVQLDINEQYALFFPETRPFFLEGADFFKTNVNLVHTRTIADPSGALKVTGKEGAHTFGLFSARDGVTNILIPGSQGSETAIFEHDTTSTVGRYRFDFGRNSTVGVLFTDRRGGGYANSVLNIDAKYRISEADTLALTVAGSQTTYSTAMSSELDLPSGKIEDGAFSVRYRHSERNWNVRADYDDFGVDFRADVGFVPQVDYRKGIVGGGFTWWGGEGAPYNSLQVGGDVDYTEEQDGRFFEKEAEAWLTYRGPWQSVATLSGGSRVRAYDGVDYDQDFVAVRANARPTGMFGFGGSVNFSDWIDFDHSRPARYTAYAPWVDVNFGKHLHFSLNYSYSRLDVDDGELFDTGITALRATYQLNAKAFLRAVVQYVEIDRDPELYSDAVDAENEDLFTQFLFSYTLNPQSVVYIGYSDQSGATEYYDMIRANRTFFVKLGYAWLL